MKGKGWRFVRLTKGGRRVERKTFQLRSAKSGIAAWLGRSGIHRSIGQMDPRRYSYSFTVTFKYRFVGDRRIYTGKTDVVLRAQDFTKPVGPRTVAAFRKDASKFPHMTKGAFDIYRTAVHDLIMAQGVFLPGSVGWRMGAKKVKGGWRKGRFFKREYAVFQLGIEVERIRRRC